MKLCPTKYYRRFGKIIPKSYRYYKEELYEFFKECREWSEVLQFFHERNLDSRITSILINILVKNGIIIPVGGIHRSLLQPSLISRLLAGFTNEEEFYAKLALLRVRLRMFDGRYYWVDYEQFQYMLKDVLQDIKQRYPKINVEILSRKILNRIYTFVRDSLNSDYNSLKHNPYQYNKLE